MTEFGKTLQGAREAAGMTVAQLAEKTHMPPSRIEQLEAEDFSKIPAAIYGRGFVRLYCEAVGIDPKPLSDEFTEIFNGRREPEIRERRAAPEPPAAEPPKAAQTQIPEPPPPMDVLAKARETARPQASTAPSATAASATATASATAAEPPSLSRYAAPIREQATRTLPPSVWRFAILGAVAVVILWLAAIGVRALYRATSGASPADAETTAQAASAAEPTKTAETAEAKPAAANAGKTGKPRKQQKIPELYID